MCFSVINRRHSSTPSCGLVVVTSFDMISSTRVSLDDLPRIGGSHAQREVFEDALIVAYLRSGQSAGAARLLRSRMDRRPSARDAGWLGLCECNAPEA